MKDNLDGGVTEEQIKVWKGKHGKVVRIDVVDGGDLHVGYFHRPRLETMSAVTKMAKSDELKSSEVMFDNCWLGGSPQCVQTQFSFWKQQSSWAQCLTVAVQA